MSTHLELLMTDQELKRIAGLSGNARHEAGVALALKAAGRMGTPPSRLDCMVLVVRGADRELVVDSIERVVAGRRWG